MNAFINQALNQAGQLWAIPNETNAEAAEEACYAPMRENICQLAQVNGWPACLHCP
jgi:hypothetical protein